MGPVAAIRDLLRHRTLLRQFAWRAVEQRHRGSFLGLVWTVLSPLLSLGVYTFVFGFVFGGHFTTRADETSLDYALGIFLGLIIFNFLSEVLAQSPHTIVTQRNFVKKVVFPLEILPVATVGAAAFSASISLLLAVIGVTFFGHGLSWDALWLFAILPPVALIAIGCAWFFGALGVFIRDTANAMPFVIQVLIYMSFVFYPMRLLDKAPPWAQHALLANPLMHAVENLRQAVLWHERPQAAGLFYLWVCGLTMCTVGHLAFRRLRPAFADVI
ncbi:MAG TPA: ABC transporter permease [Opitutus sp.]|nr:ABC transporter permease [Opitutus sp.]